MPRIDETWPVIKKKDVTLRQRHVLSLHHVCFGVPIPVYQCIVPHTSWHMDQFLGCRYRHPHPSSPSPTLLLDFGVTTAQVLQVYNTLRAHMLTAMREVNAAKLPSSVDFVKLDKNATKLVCVRRRSYCNIMIEAFGEPSSLKWSKNAM